MTAPASDRRQFLQSLGVGVAASSVLARNAAVAATSAQSSSPLAAREKPFVDLAIATICTDGFDHHRHEPAFRLLPEIGIKNVEFNVWFPDTITPGYIVGLKERSARAGLKPVCLQGSAFGGEGRIGVLKDVGHKLALMYGARELGCRRIKCTGAARGTQGGLKSVIETCKELAPAAKELEMLILLENHAKNVLENIADYQEIFSAIDSPYIGMCLDTGHFEGAGISLHEVVEKFSSRVLHVDLKDCKERGAGHNTVLFGEGVTNFSVFLDHLLMKNYRGYLVVEMAWAQPREPIVENLQKARAQFQSYIRV
jgi:sugar phosphate isomerase/epimerase